MKERGDYVITNAAIQLQQANAWTKVSSNGGAAAEALAPDGANPHVKAIFEAMKQRIHERPELVNKVNALFQFDVAGEGGRCMDR